MTTSPRASRSDFPLLIWAGVATVGLIAATALYSYPLYHTLVEIFSMVIAGTVFATVWNARRLLERDALLFIGIAFLFFVILDVPHTLSYEGIDLFPGFSANLPTQLYLIQRYMLAFSFLIAPAYLHRRLPVLAAFAGFSLFTALALASTMVWRNFPEAFVPGQGLTDFKIYSEYVISAVLVLSVAALWVNRRLFDTRVLIVLSSAWLAFVLSEVMFTLYSSPHGLPNFIGHLSQILAFYLVYVAVVRTAFERPYDLLYREIAQSEERNRRVAETLQESLLEVPESFAGVEIAHEYRAASDVSRIGGDFYDLFELQNGNLGILLGDVSGKGLGAAATTANVKSTVHALSHVDPDPAFVLAKANDVMLGQLAEDQFVTVAFCVLNRETGVVRHGNAGHTDPILCSTGRCSLTNPPRNPPLGLFPDMLFEPDEWVMHPGDVLLLYSDGLTEARHHGALFGDENIVRAIQQLQSSSCRIIVEGVVGRAAEFARGRLPDDTAVLAIRFLGA